MYTFKELKNNIAVILQRSTDDNYVAEIGTWINISIQSLYNRYDYFHELKGTHNFTTVDGTALYYMPSDFEKPMRFYDITNNKEIKIITEEEYFDGNIAAIADGDEASAEYAYFKEVVGVKVQVATTGDTLQAKSSSASDTAEIVRIEGYLDSANTIVGYENITVTGTTAVAGSVTFYKILNVSKDSDSTGYITLEDSSGTDLAILNSTDRVLRHKAFRLGKIPDDSTTSMRVLYKKKYKKLVADYDYPFIECDDYLIYNASGLGLQQNKDTLDRAVMMQKMANEALMGILFNQNTKLGPGYQNKMVNSLAQAHRS